MKKAIAIARVSSEKQAAEDKVSHDEQLARAREWAQQEGYEIVEELREVLSGATELDPDRKDLRPKFWRAWDLLRAGEIDAIIFWEPTRFCRDKAYSGLRASTYIVDSWKYGDGIRFTINEPDRGNEFAVFMVFATNFFAAQELAAINRRFQMGAKAALAKGHKGRGRDPYGYKWDNEKKEFKVVPGEADVIKTMFSWYSGGDSLRTVAYRLTEKGIGSPDAQRGHKAAAARWQPTTVGRILARDYYASGVMTGTFMGQDYALPAPPIVDAQQFESVRERRKTARHFPRRLHTRGLFQGLIRCGSCDRTYHRGSYGGKQAANYFCPGRMNQTQRLDGTPKCHSPNQKMADTDAALWRELLAALREPNGLAEQFLDRVESEIVTLQPGLGSYSDLEALQEKRNMAVKLLTRPGISPETVEETIADLDGQIEQCESRLKGKEMQIRRFELLREQEKRLRSIIASDQNAIVEVLTVIMQQDGTLNPVDLNNDLAEWLKSNRLVVVHSAQEVEPLAEYAGYDYIVFPIGDHSGRERLGREDTFTTYVTTADKLLDYLDVKVTVSVDGRLELDGNALYYETEMQSALSRSEGRTSRLSRGC